MNRLILATLAVLGCGKMPPNPLDETFFPAGAGYEWVYERESYVWDDMASSKSVDTFSIKVVSKTTKDGLTIFKLKGGSFEDVGEEIAIAGNYVAVFEGMDTIPLVPPEDFKAKESFPGYGVVYRGDTLTLNYDVGGGYVLMLYSTERIKGVGVIRQTAEIREPPHYEGHVDRLLCFIKGRDTLWKTTP